MAQGQGQGQGGSNNQNRGARRRASEQGVPAAPSSFRPPFQLQQGGSVTAGSVPAPVEFTNRPKAR